MAHMHEQEFLFGVKKSTTDGKHWKINIMTSSKGMPVEEAVFHLEGWIDSIKKKLWNERFGSMELRK